MMAGLAHAGVGLLLAAVGAAIAGSALEPEAARAVWAGLAAGYGVQVAAFAGLLRAGRGTEGFMAAWAGGTLARFAAVAALAVWTTRSDALPAAPLLLAAVGLMMTMVLLEPVFLHLKASRE